MVMRIYSRFLYLISHINMVTTRRLISTNQDSVSDPLITWSRFTTRANLPEAISIPHYISKLKLLSSMILTNTHICIIWAFLFNIDTLAKVFFYSFPIELYYMYITLLRYSLLKPPASHPHVGKITSAVVQCELSWSFNFPFSTLTVTRFTNTD